MQRASKIIKYRSSRGYTLLEILVVITLIFIILGTVIYQLRGTISNVSPDTIAVELALSISRVRDVAVRGVSDVNARTVDVTKALLIPHPGITITTTPIADNSSCTANCYPQSSICISNQNFCFTPSNTMVFDRFSGYTQNPDVIFISSNTRKLALLITKSSDYYIAEQIRGTWYSKTQLQNLNQTSGGK